MKKDAYKEGESAGVGFPKAADAGSPGGEFPSKAIFEGSRGGKGLPEGEKTSEPVKLFGSK